MVVVWLVRTVWLDLAGTDFYAARYVCDECDHGRLNPEIVGGFRGIGALYFIAPHTRVIPSYMITRCRHRKEMTVKNEYTAVVKQEDDWWVGWIEEIPGVNCQEKTYQELKETLGVTLKEALEFNRQDALTAAVIGYKEEKIAI